MEETAIRWSDYEGHSSAIRFEALNQISESLSDLMETASRDGRPAEYMRGVEDSMMLVLRHIRPLHS